ncbi:MAG: 50S ribosomal protein L3 [Patescibacteria group bacterium]
MNKIFAKKVKMTQFWKDDAVVPVTVLELKKKNETDTLEVFSVGEKVSVAGLTKGRGFQGVVKRHGFHGGPATHGQKNRLRAPGSIGATAPQRVIKGRRMAGHMGMERVHTKNLLVANIDIEKGIIMLRGAVPGMRGTIVEVIKK